MEASKGELCLPQGAEESLQVFSRAKLLLQPLEELEQLTEQQAKLLEVGRDVASIQEKIINEKEKKGFMDV